MRIRSPSTPPPTVTASTNSATFTISATSSTVLAPPCPRSWACGSTTTGPGAVIVLSITEDFHAPCAPSSARP